MTASDAESSKSVGFVHGSAAELVATLAAYKRRQPPSEGLGGYGSIKKMGSMARYAVGRKIGLPRHADVRQTQMNTLSDDATRLHSLRQQRALGLGRIAWL